MKRKSIVGLLLGLLIFSSVDDFIAAETEIPDDDATAAADNDYLVSETTGCDEEVTLANWSAAHRIASTLLRVVLVHYRAACCARLTFSPSLPEPLHLIVSLQC
jgi:hypothetical protein